MDMESLRKLVAQQVVEVKLPGDQTIHLRKVLAADAVQVGRYLADRGFSGKEETPEAIVATQVFFISKSAVELGKVNGKSEWVKSFDCEEGRELLSHLAGGTLLKLFKHVERISDLGVDADDEKKPSAKITSSPESSASQAGSAIDTHKSYGPTLAGASGSSGGDSTVKDT